MAFPDTTYTDNESAGAGLTNKAKAAGLDLSGLQPIAQLQSAVANLLVSDPTTTNIPAGDVLAGTFGANKTGGADTGTYTFPGALAITGALTGVTTLAVSSTSVFSGAVTINAPAQIGTAAGTDVITIGGTSYGAGNPSVRFNGLTTAAVSNQTATLTNAPVSGNATFWMPVSIAGVVKYVPCW